MEALSVPASSDTGTGRDWSPLFAPQSVVLGLEAGSDVVEVHGVDHDAGLSLTTTLEVTGSSPLSVGS